MKARAYCQARARLPLATLRAAHEELGGWIERHPNDAWRWCGRAVKVIDGCGISMPDTAENRAQWSYAGGQKPGCGFPTAQMVGLFCLATGRLVRFALEAWKAHEIPLARELIAWMQPGEIVLADRGFCGWGFIALLQRKGVDVVMRAHQGWQLFCGGEHTGHLRYAHQARRWIGNTFWERDEVRDVGLRMAALVK
jgi:hypothetical protein